MVRKTKIGIIIDRKSLNSARVKIVRSREHPLYKRKYSVTTKMLVHDGKNESKTGDMVKIEETRPISKRKSWKIIKIYQQNKDIIINR